MGRVVTALTVLAAGLLFTPESLAGTQQAEACLKTRVWDGYNEGWGIRTMTSTSLEAGKTHNYEITLYRGNRYRIEACGDDAVTDVDVMLYDTRGNTISRDEGAGRTPRVDYTPENTGSYYIVVYQRAVTTDGPAGVAMAVTYR